MEGCVRFQITTDYAVRMIVYLTQNDPQVMPAKQSAEELGITYGNFSKVAALMKHKGFIRAVQGPNGGYSLAKDPAYITLYDIIKAVEGRIYINHCIKHGVCTRYGADCSQCPIRIIYVSIQNRMIATLKSKSIKELVKQAGNK